MRDRVLVLATLGAGAAATAAIVVVPPIPLAFRSPASRLVIETATAIVTFLGAYLVLGRFREWGRLDDLLLASGLGVLCATVVVFSIAPTLADFGALRTWSALLGRVLGALLVAASAAMAPRRLTDPRRAAATLMVTVVIALIVLAVVGSEFEPGPGADPLSAAPTDLLVLSYPLLGGIQLAGMAIYVFAAIAFSRHEMYERDEFRRWMAVASSFSAISFLNYALLPSLFNDWVYSGDLFRLLFSYILLVGATRVILAEWRNRAVFAVLKERGRLAREVHDGVAQELAYIARRARQLGEAGDEPVKEIAAAAQRALVDSRLAIAALTRRVDEPLDVTIAQTVGDTAARLSASVTLDLIPGVDVEPHAREALVRIATEAVSNAARHAGGRGIRVELVRNPHVVLRVCDEGPGFDPARVVRGTDSGYGLVSMRDRAASIGADFTIDSRPGEGTRIEVALP